MAPSLASGEVLASTAHAVLVFWFFGFFFFGLFAQESNSYFLNTARVRVRTSMTLVPALVLCNNSIVDFKRVGHQISIKKEWEEIKPKKKI